MKFLHTLSIFSTALLLSITACTHTHEDSEDKKQAIEIHENLKLESKKFNNMLADEFLIRMLQVGYYTDSLAHDSLEHYTDSLLIELEVIDGKFKEWKKKLVKLPGTKCNHAEGEEHVHDHVAESRLAELSDAELLDLQKLIQQELADLICELKTTVGEDC